MWQSPFASMNAPRKLGRLSITLKLSTRMLHNPYLIHISGSVKEASSAQKPKLESLCDPLSASQAGRTGTLSDVINSGLCFRGATQDHTVEREREPESSLINNRIGKSCEGNGLISEQRLTRGATLV